MGGWTQHAGSLGSTLAMVKATVETGQERGGVSKSGHQKRKVRAGRYQQRAIRREERETREPRTERQLAGVEMRSILEQPGALRAAGQSRGHWPQSHPEPQGLVLNPRASRGHLDQHVLHAWYFLRICCYCTEQSPARQGRRAD